MDYAILIRHGESEANVLKILDHDPDSKYHLTQIGRGQVEFTAERISKLKVDLILSSPLLRARETAEILSKKIKVPYEVENGITEAGLGSFHGNYYASIPPLSRGKSGMETWESMRQRMFDVVEKREGTCILVSHYCNLAFMMRKDKVRAPTMNIVGITEKCTCYRSILYIPTWPSLAI